MLVEDQDGARELAQEFLLSAGYKVLVAARGSEAFETARRHSGPIHLLLTDMVMPQRNGREAAAHLSRQAAR